MTVDVNNDRCPEFAQELQPGTSKFGNPDILLLDEPTSALSDEERDRLFSIIHRLQERGVGIVYVSHRLDEVPQIGQRVTILRDGKKIGTLPSAEVRAFPQRRREYRSGNP